MKHVFSVLSIVSVAFFTLLLSTTGVSCKKGDDGPKGADGNANVIYSPWLSVTYARVVPTPGDTSFVANINAPKITDSVVASGDVRVYVNINTAASPEIMPLPFGTLVIPYITKGKIELDALGDFSTFTQGGQTYQQYRYVIIQGSTPARRAVNLDDYNSVKQYYNIPD